MATRRSKTAPAGLSREGIVNLAIRIADAEGLAAVSMRRVANELGVDPMSLYRYVGTKDGLLDLMTDAVVSAIEPVEPSGDWVATARGLMLAARRTMLGHPWTTQVIKARDTPTPAALGHLNTLLRVLREAGLSIELTHHALHVLGSRVLGFSDDLYDDSGGSRPEAAVTPAQAAEWAKALPWIAELAAAVTHGGALGGCDDDEEFAFSVDLILEGLERRRRESLVLREPTARASN